MASISDDLIRFNSIAILNKHKGKTDDQLNFIGIANEFGGCNKKVNNIFTNFHGSSV